MHTRELDVDASRERIIDLTAELERFCAGLGDGLVNVFVPHATAGRGPDGDRLGLREPTCSPRWSGSCRATTATSTRTVRRGTGPITCCPPW